MKIMMIVARLNIGGVALNVIQMTHHLAQMPDVEVLLVNGQVGEQEGDMQYMADAYRIPQVILPSLGRELSPMRDLKTLWQLWRLMRQFRPDVVHTHTAKAGFIGRWAAWLAGVKVRVHTFHGHVFHGYFSPRKTQFFLWLERFSARISSRIITLSEALRSELADRYRVANESHIAVIPLGLDLQPFVDAARHGNTFRRELGIAPDVPLIGVVGRLVPIKNHRLFLEAAHLLHQQRGEVRFVIIGDGELRAQIEGWIETLGLQGIVTIKGWMKEVAAAYADLDLVTITSDNEGTPVSLLEAMAAGVPIVSTNVGGVADLVGQALLSQLVPPNDAAALCAAWLRTLDNPPNMQASQAQILAQYDIRQVAEKHLDLYRALLTVRQA